MSMFNKVSKSFMFGQHEVTLTTGEIARQASGAVVVQMGDTVILATVVAKKETKPGQDFFPLTVDYIEKAYAAGKFPGGFFKREGRPSEHETLTSRLIDRPIGRMDQFRHPVQGPDRRLPRGLRQRRFRLQPDGFPAQGIPPRSRRGRYRTRRADG